MPVLKKKVLKLSLCIEPTYFCLLTKNQRLSHIKGYVRIITNLGPLNLELHCDMVPKTCENFMMLCKKGYYNNTKFHRSIKHFMVIDCFQLDCLFWCSERTPLNCITVDSRRRSHGHWYRRGVLLGRSVCWWIQAESISYRSRNFVHG